MKHALVTLFRNLAAGARLALFRPVGMTSFRITLGALLALVVAALALDVALDAIRVGTGGIFNVRALEPWSLATLAFLATTSVLALAFRHPPLAVALAVMVLAAGMLLQLAGFGYRMALENAGRWTPSLAWLSWIAWLLLTLWSAAVIARAIAIALPESGARRWLGIVAGTFLLLGTAILVETRFHPADFWYAARDPAERTTDWSVVTEQALVRQPQLLAESLQALEPQRPGIVDLYFVGFAPYASQDVFRKDVVAARIAVSERFDTAKRSIELVSNPRTVLETPIASASNLRATLKAVGERIDRNEDVVMLFLTSHGSKEHRLSVEFYPLRLDSLNAADLKSMLDDAGIRWRIVVISACYSGGFIPALADERTIVMAAAAADRTSFGCSNDSDMTFFTDALFNQALRTERSLLPAFERARTLVSERERAEGFAPSDPQISLGAAIREKLVALESKTPPAACAAGPC
jgi:hypothetical protein